MKFSSLGVKQQALLFLRVYSSDCGFPDDNVRQDRHELVDAGSNLGLYNNET